MSNKIKLLLFGLAATFNINSITPDNAVATVSGLLSRCEAQYDDNAAFNYAGCITNAALQLNPDLDPANLNGVMEYYTDNMAWHTENLLNEQEQYNLNVLNAPGGIISFLTSMSPKFLALLFSKIVFLMGLGFIARNAVAGCTLAKNYLLGAMTMTTPVEPVEADLKQATAQLLTIRKVISIKTAATVAIARKRLMEPILRARARVLLQEAQNELEIAATLEAATLKAQEATQELEAATLEAAQEALNQIITKIDEESRLTSKPFKTKTLEKLEKITSKQKRRNNILAARKRAVVDKENREYRNSSSIGGRNTKNKRNSRNSRNSRNKRNSRRK